MNTPHPPLAQRAFLAAEAAGNRVFGDRCNPLYHLGTISYFLFWIVAGSGIYLYAFFETSASQAHASVESITHTQWYAGGLLRSAHRYASDLLVLTMLLHLTRHFAFGRHRGYRWLSWITGLALLGLAWVAGINGYMLPWDQLAQFTVTATTEMLDVLPVIGGALARNFITNTAVSDRLFSLLAFVHIGVSLGMLALLWVHTQRTPAARTLPPQRLMASVTVLLLVLALVRPAVSLAPADLAQVPATLAFDWFYLPVLAWAHQGHLPTVWATLVAGGLLLAALPWIRLRRASRASRGFDLAVHPDDRIIAVRAGETLLDAGLREGLAMPYDCRNGGCGRCQCTLLHGEVQLMPYQPAALSAADAALGQTLLCCAVPLTDVEIRYVPAATGRAAPLRRHAATVRQMERLTPDVMRLMLALEGGGRLPYRAGQYINILLDDGAKRSFSFASSPHEASQSGLLELHIRRIAGGRFTTHVFEAMKTGDRLAFEGPLGAFSLREDSVKPILFVAGFTGFAPVKSMVEHALRVGLDRTMVLYWGVRRPRDMYLAALAESWQAAHANFRFVPVVSDAQPEDHWTGRTGLVHEAILADFPDLSRHQVYACGSVGMVEAAYPAFLGRGISPDDCFSDAFHLAPHAPIASRGAEVVQLGGAHA
ncbi:MAG: cytochrome b N-terminal domain-containing protein [Betaproteobacteria bacterium]|nr:cytochrome b N-terminal domain-containing protein [Betaproteobacteria bacterium]